MLYAAVLLCTALALGACDFTITNERPSYEQLDPEEKDVVALVLGELERLDAQIRKRTKYDIKEVVDRERIHVSFEGLIFSANLGDDVIHVSVWENLGQGKQQLVQQWFESSTPAAARATYAKFFYHFMAVVQGAKQFMYKVHGTEWIYKHRTLFTLERDSIRTALAHYVAEGRKSEMWGALQAGCTPVISQYASSYESKFDKRYLQENFAEIFDPENPSGYMYFVCRWIELGRQEAEGLTAELDWLADLNH